MHKCLLYFRKCIYEGSAMKMPEGKMTEKWAYKFTTLWPTQRHQIEKVVLKVKVEKPIKNGKFLKVKFFNLRARSNNDYKKSKLKYWPVMFMLEKIGSLKIFLSQISHLYE